MRKIISLYDQLNAAGVRFYHWNMEDDAAAVVEMDGQYGVFMDFTHIRTAAEELVAVAHEGGHVSTGATHAVGSPFDLVERSEYRANRWAAEHCLTEADFRDAFAAGYTELWELAEYFDLPEQDVKNALTYWSERKGIDFNT